MKHINDFFSGFSKFRYSNLESNLPTDKRRALGICTLYRR